MENNSKDFFRNLGLKVTNPGFAPEIEHILKCAPREAQARLDLFEKKKNCPRTLSNTISKSEVLALVSTGTVQILANEILVFVCGHMNKSQWLPNPWENNGLPIEQSYHCFVTRLVTILLTFRFHWIHENKKKGKSSIQSPKNSRERQRSLRKCLILLNRMIWILNDKIMYKI